MNAAESRKSLRGLIATVQQQAELLTQALDQLRVAGLEGLPPGDEAVLANQWEEAADKLVGFASRCRPYARVARQIAWATRRAAAAARKRARPAQHFGITP